MALDAQTSRFSPHAPAHALTPARVSGPCVLVTRNLTMRPPLDLDAEPIAEALADASVSRNLSRVPHPYALEDALDWLARITDRPDDIVYTVHREQLVGVVAVHLHDEGPMLGYWFRPCAWGKGYATQAARAVLAQAFRILGCEAINSAAYEDNIASQRVLEKLGFEPVGKSTQPNPTRGKDVATLDMRLTRAAFETRFGTLETEGAA